MTRPPRAELPPRTVDDLMEATGKSRRTVLDILRQYVVATGREIARYPRRNFLEMRLTQEQYDEVLSVVRRSEEEGYSYAELFHELATGRMLNQPLGHPGGEAAMLDRLTQMTEQLTDLRTYAGTLESRLDELTKQAEALATSNLAVQSKLDRLQETLDKALSPME